MWFLESRAARCGGRPMFGPAKRLIRRNLLDTGIVALNAYHRAVAILSGS